AGRVLVEEVITFQGLEVQRRKVAYGNVDPEEATKIFIRSALVEEDIAPPGRHRAGHFDSDESNESNSDATEKELPPQYRFLIHNRAVRQKIENWQTRVRRYDFSDPDEALFEFYSKRIGNVSSIHELNRFLREHPNQDELCVSEADLTGGQ